MRTTLTVKLAYICCLIGLIFGASRSINALQPNTTRTIRDGVFTTAQASLGQELFEANCARCHGEDLLGANARPLAGDAFIRDWGGLTLDQFYERVSNMPPGAPSSLADTDYLNIITYVLQVNEFPSGVEALALHMLSNIDVEGEGGPGEVPDFSLVQVVGCLSQTQDGDWLLTNASAPIRTRDPSASSGDNLAETMNAELGTDSYRLMYVFPEPSAYDGHRVETKGFLIRGPQDALNVTVIASLEGSCTFQSGL